MNAKQELANAGLELCNEIEKLMLEGKADDALIPATKLLTRLEALGQSDPDCLRGYMRFGEMLFGSVFDGNPYFVGLGLWLIRLLLAEELQDDPLLQALLKSPPQLAS